MSLQRFAEHVWIAAGPTVRAALVPVPTRMIVVQLDEGSLWINSPIVASPAILDDVRALGTIRHLVAPTPLHAWRLEEWRSLFPEAQCWWPPMMGRGLSQVAFDTVAGISRPKASQRQEHRNILGDDPPDAWVDDLDQLIFRGNNFVEEVEFLHPKSGTLIMADFIQNYPAKRGDVVGNIAKRIAGVLDGGVPRDIRWSTTDKELAHASLRKLLSWHFDKLIVAHGSCVDHDARAVVEVAFRWLTG